MGELENLVGKPEEYIKEKSTKLLAEYDINYPDGYVFCGNSNEAYCEIADIFYDMRDEMKEQLLNSLDSGDMRGYSVNVHALKSNARSLGIKELADIAYSHELKSKEGDVAYCRDNWDALVEVWKRNMTYLSVYLKTMDIDKHDPGMAALLSGDGSDVMQDTAVTDDSPVNSFENDPNYLEAKANIISLIESGMEDIAFDVINDLANEGQDQDMIASLRSLLP